MHPNNPAGVAWMRLWRWFAIRATWRWQHRLMFIAMLPWTGPVRKDGKWRWSLRLWHREQDPAEDDELRKV